MLNDLFDFKLTKDFLSHRAPLFRSFQGFSEQVGILSDDYFSLLNPMFSICIDDLSVLSPYKVVSFRDGFLGLGCFFSRFPLPPKNFRTFIGVPAYLASVVPKYWREHIYFYQFKLKKPGASQFLTIFQLPDLDYGFGNTRQLNKIEGLVQDNDFQDFSKVDLNLSHFFSQDHIDSFDFKARSVPLEDLLSKIDLKGHYAFFPIEPFVVYDHFLIHALMSKNAQVMTPLISMRVDDKYDLSLFHEVHISFMPPRDFGDTFKDFLRVWNGSNDLFFRDPTSLKKYRELFEKEFILRK